MKKKSSPASRALTLIFFLSCLSLHEPIRVSAGKGTFCLTSGSLGLAAQLAPRWNVYGLGAFFGVGNWVVGCELESDGDEYVDETTGGGRNSYESSEDVDCTGAGAA
ncbi:hypothetical protein CPB83DRAFT_846708 [Crepidotus variabilis]|uniref:Uncharacterized protein n=1 Tax=Crepidotus variabilis TaxID=179855 RepID=A0A9P6EPW4_9AGAR|nr:hypothetical protein CPB83DRAFT_846708 [Crepidotus variabilis]